MEVEKEAFGGLIEYYKRLPIDIKRKEVIDGIEEIISNYSKICTKFGIMPNMILNKEMLNVNRKNITEDEFLDALYAYLNSLEDVSAQFIDKMSNIIENIDYHN